MIKNKAQGVTPIVIAFTPNYLIPAATTLWSVLKHADVDDQFEVVSLLSEPLSDAFRNILESIDTHNRVRFSYIELQHALKDVYVDEKYTVAASFRLLISELLPEYDTVIYMDCDMIIRNNLADLYRNIDLGDNYLAAVFEATLDFQIPGMRKLGFLPGEYFNSGFLVMNLSQLRKDGMSKKFVEALQVDYLEFPDQDVLNMLCKNRVTPLPPYYNSIRTFYLPQYKHFFLQKYSPEDWDAVWEHGSIHYTGDKPWRSFTVQFDVWWQYFLELPAKTRQYATINKKIFALYRFYSTPFGKFCVEKARELKRRLHSQNIANRNNSKPS